MDTTSHFPKTSVETTEICHDPVAPTSRPTRTTSNVSRLQQIAGIGLLAVAGLVGCGDGKTLSPPSPGEREGISSSSTGGTSTGETTGGSTGTGNTEPEGTVATNKIYKINGPALQDCNDKTTALLLKACSDAGDICSEMQGTDARFTFLGTTNHYPNSSENSYDSFVGYEGYAGVIASGALPHGIRVISGTEAKLQVLVENPANPLHGAPCSEPRFDEQGNWIENETAAIDFEPGDTGPAVWVGVAKDAFHLDIEK